MSQYHELYVLLALAVLAAMALTQLHFLFIAPSSYSYCIDVRHDFYEYVVDSELNYTRDALMHCMRQ